MKMEPAQPGYDGKRFEGRLLVPVLHQVADDRCYAFVIVHKASVRPRPGYFHPVIAVIPTERFQTILHGIDVADPTPWITIQRICPS